MVPLTPADLDFLDKFIRIAKDVAKLRVLLLPQYRAAASALYEICKRLLDANENLARWLYRFLYFNFAHPDAKVQFLQLVADYRTMKTGQEFHELKFRCGDIAGIYYQEIASKIGSWFKSNRKLQDAETAFQSLSMADADMVNFVYDTLILKLDAFVAEAETLIDSGRADEAEASRLAFKAEFRPITEKLERFSGLLSELVIEFAAIAKQPITLSRT